MALRSRLWGLAVLSVICVGSASRGARPTTSFVDCRDHFAPLAFAMQRAEELQRQLQRMQRKVEQSRWSVLELQRGLKSCEAAASAAAGSLWQHLQPSNALSTNEVSGGSARSLGLCCRQVLTIHTMLGSPLDLDSWISHGRWARR